MMSYEESVFLGGVPGKGWESVVDVPAGGGGDSEEGGSDYKGSRVFYKLN